MIILIGVAGVLTYSFMKPGKVETQPETPARPLDPDRAAKYKNRILMAENYERMALESKDPKDRHQLLKRAHDARAQAAEFQ